MDPSGCFMLTAANVGKCQAVLCRDGKPLPLSKLYNVCCAEELERVKQHKAIVTEVKYQIFSRLNELYYVYLNYIIFFQIIQLVQLFMAFQALFSDYIYDIELQVQNPVQ